MSKLSPNTPSSFSVGQKWSLGLQAVVGGIAFVAIVVMLNYLAARHYQRLDLSANRERVLSPQTLRVLASITNEFKVTVFFDKDSEAELYDLSTSLLREYNSANPNIIVKTVDPTRRPAEAELVLAEHKITGLKDKNFIIFDCDGRTRLIYENELSDYDINAVISGKSQEFKRKTFNGELLFTTAIFNLAHPREFKVCFLSGHGEHDPEKTEHPHGYAKFAQILTAKCNAQWEKITLLGTNEIPDDCQLLVIAGARLPIESVELEKIGGYLRRGGRLFALMGNLAYTAGKRTGLEDLLREWGVGVANNLVFDPRYSPTGNDLLTAQMNNEHPIMKALLSADGDMRLRLILPRAVGQSTIATNRNVNPDAAKITVLAATSDGGEEATDIVDGVPYRNPYANRTGVFPLAVAVEQGRVQDVTVQRGAMRMIVLGDSLCLDNELIDNAPANHLFAGLAVDWLLDRPQVLLEGLVPQPLKSYQIVMTPHESRTIRWVLLFGFPGIALALGGMIWLRRRN